MASRSSRAIAIAPAYVRWMPSFWNQSLWSREAPAQSTRISSGCRRAAAARVTFIRAKSLRRSDRFAQTTRWTPTLRKRGEGLLDRIAELLLGLVVAPDDDHDPAEPGAEGGHDVEQRGGPAPSNGQLTPTRRRQTATSMSTSRPLSTICSGSSFQITAVITESPITVRCGGAASPRTEAGAVAASGRDGDRRGSRRRPPSPAREPRPANPCRQPPLPSTDSRWHILGRATTGRVLMGGVPCPGAERHDLDRGGRRRAPATSSATSIGGRTVLVTGADGFMGSHLTEALVELGANVHAFVRATSSGALNNIGHLRSAAQGALRRPDRQDVGRLPDPRAAATRTDRPYVFHLGAQAHVGESWHRPYETVMANTVGTLNLLQSIVDTGLEIEKFDTAGTSEEYGNVRDDVAHHHDFDDDGGLILHERSPINPKSIYATAKVAADFLTMNYHDAFGLPGVVTRMFNNYGPRQNPRYVTGTIITQALDPRRRSSSATSSRCATSASARTASAAT